MQAISSTTSGVFDETECQVKLSSDLNGALGRILIVSPFATVQAIKRWRTHFEAAIERGVSVCAIIQEPINWERRHDGTLAADCVARLRLLEAAIELLQSIGVHVTLRPKMHEKMIVIDDCILWEGSINFLSWFNTSERARRWIHRAEVAAAVEKHKMLPCSYRIAPSLGQQLAQKRISLGLRQEELAIMAATHRKLVGQVEAGKRDLRVEILNRICDALGFEMLIVPKHLACAARRFVQSRTVPDQVTGQNP